MLSYRGKDYIGYTNDPHRRESEHRSRLHLVISEYLFVVLYASMDWRDMEKEEIACRS